MDNTWYTRRRQTRQTHNNKCWTTHGTQDEDKQDKLTTISDGQHMVHKTKTNKTNSQQ